MTLLYQADKMMKNFVGWQPAVYCDMKLYHCLEMIVTYLIGIFTGHNYFTRMHDLHMIYFFTVTASIHFNYGIMEENISQFHTKQSNNFQFDCSSS